MPVKFTIKIFSLLFLLFGLTAGLILVDRNQDLRKKAVVNCDAAHVGLCGPDGGCPTGQKCSRSGGALSGDNLQYSCVSNSTCSSTTTTCISAGGSCFDGGCPSSGYTDKGRLNCPVDFRCCVSSVSSCKLPNVCQKYSCSSGYTNTSGTCSMADSVCCKPAPATTSGPCSSSSNSLCVGKKLGDSCGSGLTCQTGTNVENGADGLIACKCRTGDSTGTSGSTGTGGGGSSDDQTSDSSGDSDSTSDSSTPTQDQSGTTGGSCVLMAGERCSSASAAQCARSKTGVGCKPGKICIGWPGLYGNDNKVKCSCVATSEIPQCTPTDGTPTAGGLKLLFRQQGITSKPPSTIASQYKVDVSLQKGGVESYKIDQATAVVDNQGVWSIPLSKDGQGNAIVSGTYDIFIKGLSHLRKKFTGVNLGQTVVAIDKSISSGDELKCGDVNGDNAITIEDVAIILKYYTTFSVPVDANKAEMVAADINKDAVITIEDIALIALNWTDFSVAGD